LADQPGYPCCTFRGSVLALDANTGKILWQTFVMPTGYSGGAIWQQPAVDTTRGLIFVGTGNNYSVPASVEQCELKNPGDPSCTPAHDYFDTALALDINTGTVKWGKHLYGYDVWTQACIHPKQGVTCPDPAGPDYDMGGSGPNLLENIVGFGQKTGIYWALNPSTGAVVWNTMVGPAGPLGGIQWGTASDGKNIYVAIANSKKSSYKLISGQTITWGAWSALDAATGKILANARPNAGNDRRVLSEHRERSCLYRVARHRRSHVCAECIQRENFVEFREWWISARWPVHCEWRGLLGIRLRQDFWRNRQ